MKHYLKILTVSALLGAFFLCSSALAKQYLSVAQDGINVRSGPGTDTTIIYEFPQGYPLEVLEHHGQWLKVVDYEGAKGYVFSSLLTQDPHVIVSVKDGNVRSDPSIKEDNIVGTVVQDVIFEKIDQKGDWVQVRHPQLEGWVHKSLLWPHY
ncbi:SH3 domain-containing protein [Desulfobulbus rhabdoformis]|jgi:SH3-like domain-containing protein|uniref:SH3 domain-containing protein n=1 Tax=Desulfobulbus rhabdoformis TaxID=34032 RepID=UPI001965D0F2|nr:SH3 domain-containing protein [Desulfobulbus rhabdoformis]MBM9615412.1 SH3 domain-containing protein [Desulfobulbus rhabdoformis]